jgi:cell division protein FtsB
VRAVLLAERIRARRFRAARPAAEKQSRAARRRSREARRRRFMLGGGALLSLVILGAWFPANALYHQHSNLASAEAQLNVLHEQDAALAQEQKNLNDSSEISRIAREQYQLVSPGQQAFEVLPKTGSSHAEAPYSGDPGLSAPVAPSSASILPPGSGTTTTQPAKATRVGARTNTSNAHPAAPSPGVAGRMLDALEFWR